jgi:hypothetical protein
MSNGKGERKKGGISRAMQHESRVTRRTVHVNRVRDALVVTANARRVTGSVMSSGRWASGASRTPFPLFGRCEMKALAPAISDGRHALTIAAIARGSSNTKDDEKRSVLQLTRKNR